MTPIQTTTIPTAPAVAISSFLPRVSPESVGVPSSQVSAFLDALAARDIRVHSFVMVCHGAVFAEGYAEPYTPTTPQTVYSLSKSFTSVAVAMARSDGLLDLDEHLVDVFPEDLPAEVSPWLRALRIRHCLTMTTGQVKEPAFDGGDWVRSFLAEPLIEPPGTHFRYNTMATYMLSAVLHRRGIDLESYLQQRLCTPLGVEGVHWIRSPAGICAGGFGMSAVPELVAKFGQLLLQRGEWEGRPLVDADYLVRATSKVVDTDVKVEGHTDFGADWALGYGYQFWQTRSASFRGDGMFGQFCVVSPDEDLVLAMTAFTDDMQGQLDAYFGTVVAAAGERLPADDAAHAALLDRCRALSVAPADVADDGGPIPDGLVGSRYVFAGTQRLGALDAVPFHELSVSTDGQDLLVGTDWRVHRAARRRHGSFQVAGPGFPTTVLGAWGTRGPDTVLVHVLWPEMLIDVQLELTVTGTGLHAVVRDTRGAEPAVLLDAVGTRA